MKGLWDQQCTPEIEHREDVRGFPSDIPYYMADEGGLAKKEDVR